MNSIPETKLIEIEKGQRQLFLDNDCIGSMQGLTRTMHQPEKRGTVIKAEMPWEVALQIRCAPAWDEQEGQYKLWLSTGAIDGEMTCAVSKDGVHWDRPELGQKMFRGSFQNNLITLDPRLHWPDNCIENAVCDPDDPDPGCRYKGFLGVDGRRPIVSPDGLHWRLFCDLVLPSSDESNLSLDRQTHTFIATLKQGGPYGRAQGVWISRDFSHWEKMSVFSADAEDQRLGRINIENHFLDNTRQKNSYNVPETYNVDIYNLGVFKYEGLYIGIPSMFHQTGKVDGTWEGFDRFEIDEDMRAGYKQYGDKGGFHHLQLMCSRDLKQWERLGDRRPFIDLSPLGVGAYDINSLTPPSSPLIMDRELWFYYTGQKSYDLELSRKEAFDRSAICYAVLRRDGFVSLDAGGETGELITRPFMMDAAKLSVNADARAGVFEVAVIDESGTQLAASRKIFSDEPCMEVQWQPGNLAAVNKQIVRLKFTMKNARFYAFWLDG